jgi:putative membrane protein
MKNIWKICKNDFNRISHNVIAIVVIMGITVLPCLYAWFNIAASWDPYANTGELKVAVVSVDTGYDGTIVPVHFNVGEQVLSELRANSQLDWIFTTEEKAIDGVKSGEFYAAIVIPENFSKNMMSIFSDNISNPKIKYYSNDKENAIAPRVTDKGATTIQAQINEIFTKTIADTALTDLQLLSKIADESGEGNLAQNLAESMEQISMDLYSAADTVNAFAIMTSFSQQMLTMTNSLLGQAQTKIGENLEAIESSGKATNTIKGVVENAKSKINNGLDSGKNFYREIAEQAKPVFLSKANIDKNAADRLNNMANQMDFLMDPYKTLRNNMVTITPSNSNTSNIVNNISNSLDDAIEKQKELQSALRDASSFASNNAKSTTNAKNDLDNLAGETSQNIQSLKSNYEEKVQPALNNLLSDLQKVEDNMVTLMEELEYSLGDIRSFVVTTEGDMEDLENSLGNSYALLIKTAEKLHNSSQKLISFQNSDDFSLLEFMLEENPEDISEFLASPVELNTTEVYSIKNYGSAMAPFYSTLAIWIGGIVLAAMIKVKVPSSYYKELSNLKPHEMYFGRSIMFIILGILQSTLICVGDLCYLGIQCEHPILYVLAGWVSGIVYVNIIYTLTFAFGAIGKAIAVVLLVMQVAGTGGTFPIQVLPKFFQIVYPLMPFTHSMTAMRECIGGMYKMTYWIALGEMFIFLIVFVALGLVFGKAGAGLTNKFAEKLKETKIM